MSLAPNYLLEKYTANVSFINGNHVEDKRPVEIFFLPYDNEQPGLKILYSGKKKTQHICRPHDLHAIIIEHDIANLEVQDYSSAFQVQIRNSGEMESFISCIAGYYRYVHVFTIELFYTYV